MKGEPGTSDESGTTTWCAVCLQPYDFRPTREGKRDRHRLRISLCKPCKLEARARVLRGRRPVPPVIREVVERMEARFALPTNGQPEPAGRG